MARLSHSNPSLTGRELHIASCLALGESNAQVARRLSVSPHTVAAHLGNMLNKVGAKNRTELVARLYAAGVFKCGQRLESIANSEPPSSDADALKMLSLLGRPAGPLSRDHRAVLAALDSHDIRVLKAIKERLDATTADGAPPRDMGESGTDNGRTVSEQPWRRSGTSGAKGLPAWSVSTRTSQPEEFSKSLLLGVDSEWAWGGADGSGVKVCLLDTGISNENLTVGQIDRSMTVVERGDGSLGIGECEARDDFGHGTACAEVIRSIAPAASLSSMKVLTSGKTGTGAALLAGLAWAVEEGFDVINMSLATTQAKFAAELHELADRAYFRRSILVAAAHNRPIPSFPWSFSSVISVACHDETNPLTYYYNPAAPTEFHARGVKVPAAARGGGTTRWTGNSFASPHIAGICALILSKHAWLTPFQVKTVLFHCAHNVSNAEGHTYDSRERRASGR